MCAGHAIGEGSHWLLGEASSTNPNIRACVANSEVVAMQRDRSWISTEEA
jgi:hypothetical protein